MWNFPNFLSFLRLPLALLFLPQKMFLRTFVLLTAMVTDALDGYLARRYGLTSWFGALLDPLTDKFFALFVLSILLFEGRIDFIPALTLLSRDMAVLFFSVFLVLRRRLTSYKLRAIWCGKLTTTLQFFAFLALLYGYELPTAVYGLFVLLGLFALIELYLFDQSK